MAFVHGKATAVLVNAVDLSAFTKESELSLANSEHNVTHFGDNDEVYQAGLGSGTYSMNGTFDNAATNTPDLVFVPLRNAAAFAVLFRPEGTGSTLRERSFNAILTDYTESDPHDDMVTWSADMRISGAVAVANQV